MRRRELLGLLGAAVVGFPLDAYAQPSRLPKIGVLLVGNREPFWREFTEGLREIGYVDGQNLDLIVRSAQGKLNALPDLAADSCN